MRTIEANMIVEENFLSLCNLTIIVITYNGEFYSRLFEQIILIKLMRKYKACFPGFKKLPSH